MLVKLEGMVIDDNKVFPAIKNMNPPSTVSPFVNTTWEREEQELNASSPIISTR